MPAISELGESKSLNIRIYVGALVLFAFLLWLLRPVLLPFVAGIILAWLLNPLVTFLVGWRLPRSAASVLVLFATAGAIACIGILLAPLLQSQVEGLINKVPSIMNALQKRVIPWVENLATNLAPDDIERLRGAATQYVGDAVNLGGKVIKGFVSSGKALFDVITLLIIAPVVAFFILRDWQAMTDTIQSLVPRPWLGTVNEQLFNINQTLSGFLRGQALVCLCLGIIYGVGLSIIGLDYGATLGLLSGILSFVPYLGSIFCLVSSIGLGVLQFTHWHYFAAILAVFAVGQIMEGYVLTPKLVGSRVGLHPVWILFALLAGASLLGFTGVLIAVPTAATIGVLTRFALMRYRESKIWKG